MKKDKKHLESQDLTTDNKTSGSNKTEENTMGFLSALTIFATSERGHQLMNKVFELSEKKHRWDNIPRYLLTFAAIVIGGWLSYEGKLDATMGVLLGSVMGYMFGKKDD